MNYKEAKNHLTIKQIRDCPGCIAYAKTLSNAQQWLKHCKQVLTKKGWMHETKAGKAFHLKNEDSISLQKNFKKYLPENLCPRGVNDPIYLLNIIFNENKIL